MAKKHRKIIYSKKSNLIKYYIKHSKGRNNELDVDFMSNPFRPKYSNIVKIVNYENSSARIKKVMNSKFELYAEVENTRRSKAVRLTEILLNEVHGVLPEDFEMPCVVVVDFKIFNVDAIGGYDKNCITMYINSTYNTKNKIMNYLHKNEGSFANLSIYAPILHELGHKYYYDVVKRNSMRKNISYNESEQEVKDRIADYVHKRNENGDFLETHLSKYAQDGYRRGKYGEIVAESFSAVDYNDTAKEIIKLIGDI